LNQQKKSIWVAGAQIKPEFLRKDRNLNQCREWIEKAMRERVDLLIFPECMLNGYMMDTLEEALETAETIPGPITEQLASFSRETGIYLVVGMLEKELDLCFNTAILIGPKGYIGKYRKTHIPFMGVDRFVQPGGKNFRTFKVQWGTIGLAICYDICFPEMSRILALMGADIIVNPTNWPLDAEILPQSVVPTRAYENHVYVVAVNRIGEEKGTTFLGKTTIASPSGKIVIQGGRTSEELLIAELKLEKARDKHIVIQPGKYEFNFFKDRNPELYTPLNRRNKYRTNKTKDLK
jgi:predicted amidohydrolase